MNHRARVLKTIRQIEEMELTRDEIIALYNRHFGRGTTASGIIADAAREVVSRERLIACNWCGEHHAQPAQNAKEALETCLKE